MEQTKTIKINKAKKKYLHVSLNEKLKHKTHEKNDVLKLKDCLKYIAEKQIFGRNTNIILK